MTSDSLPISPRLAALHAALGDTDDAAATLDAFWRDMDTTGTPLVEPLEDQPDAVLVTLVYCARSPVSHVVVIDGAVGARELDSPERRMTRLLDTDLWYKSYPLRRDTRTVYCFSPNDSLVRERDVTDWTVRMATWERDPFNPHNYDDGAFVYSVLALPAAPAQPWIRPQTDVPAGQLHPVRLPSVVLENERAAWVYTPPAYTLDGAPYGLLLLFDGWAYHHEIPTPTILENLWAQGLIPPLVTVLLEAAPGARPREFGCSQGFCAFLEQELIPWVRQHYHVGDDPARNVVGGASFGGLAAAFAALRAPHLWGNVLSQSGAYWWRPARDDEDEWLARYVSRHPRQAVRFYLEVGIYERAAPPTGGLDNLDANRHLRTVLRAKDYAVQYAEFAGGHDAVCWRGSLADGLIALLGHERLPTQAFV